MTDDAGRTGGEAGEDDARDGEAADHTDGRGADGEGVVTATEGPIHAEYEETGEERLLSFRNGDNGHTAAVAQNREGYAMLKVRPRADGDELERYYGFDMALDHAAELLGVRKGDLPVPEAAADMGM